MPIPVPDAYERRELIAYLAQLSPSPSAKAATPRDGPPVSPASPGLRAGAAGFGDYRADGPGVRRHFTVADLPAPFATASATGRMKSG